MAALMLGYSIRSSSHAVMPPAIIIGQLGASTAITPADRQNGGYWIVILNKQNPKQTVKEWMWPWQNHATVPPGLDAYMSNPDYIFAVITDRVGSSVVPQGDFYDFLVKYGAGRELKRLEQISMLSFSGSYTSVSYILTGQCGPRVPLPPASYEAGSIYQDRNAFLLMSLESMPNGNPPFGLSDTYTFKTR